MPAKMGLGPNMTELSHRRIRVTACVTAGLLLAGGAGLYLTATPSLWIGNLDRITCGMTRDEVVAALEKPADAEWVYTGQSVWFAMDGRILIRFGSDGRVTHFHAVHENVLVRQFRRLRDWLGFS